VRAAIERARARLADRTILPSDKILKSHHEGHEDTKETGPNRRGAPRSARITEKPAGKPTGRFVSTMNPRNERKSSAGWARGQSGADTNSRIKRRRVSDFGLLSAQATDKSVNPPPPDFFPVANYAAAISRSANRTPRPSFRSIGLYRTKAKEHPRRLQNSSGKSSAARCRAGAKTWRACRSGP